MGAPVELNGLVALDDDPDEAVAVLTGNAMGDRAYAAICLGVAIRAGAWPRGWHPRG